MIFSLQVTIVLTELVMLQLSKEKPEKTSSAQTISSSWPAMIMKNVVMNISTVTIPMEFVE